MEGFVKGEVIVLEFPFTNFKYSKRRPALIIKVPKGEDVIICQITAESQEKSLEIPIKAEDFIKGRLKRDSYIRIDKITTIKKTRIEYKIGLIREEKFNEIIDTICNFLK